MTFLIANADQIHCLFNKEESNLLFYLLFLRFYDKNIPTNSFFRIVFTDNPDWMDVEGFIKKIATEKTFLSNLYECMKTRNMGSYDSSNQNLRLSWFLSKLGLPEKGYDNSTIMNILSDNLTDFEERFLKYIKEKVNERKDYSSEQNKFVEKILSTVKSIAPLSSNIQIINFNYTKNKNNNYNEINVHGSIDDRIVIGYDSTQKEIGTDEIYGLSKDWRKIDIDYNFELVNHSIDDIIIYGHSLGEQDYPYFFELFDNANLLSNEGKTKIILCYSKWNPSDSFNKAFSKYKMNASKLLNAYERAHNKSITRNTIVTKLKMNNRLLFVEVK